MAPGVCGRGHALGGFAGQQHGPQIVHLVGAEHGGLGFGGIGDARRIAGQHDQPVKRRRGVQQAGAAGRGSQIRLDHGRGIRPSVRRARDSRDSR